MAETGLPLEGVRVVEMTHMVMGPTCGMILAQLGAEVIKVEPPAGDKTRSLGGMGTSFFPLFNRGKRSIVLDFAKPEDRETVAGGEGRAGEGAKNNRKRQFGERAHAFLRSNEQETPSSREYPQRWLSPADETCLIPSLACGRERS